MSDVKFYDAVLKVPHNKVSELLLESAKWHNRNYNSITNFYIDRAKQSHFTFKHGKTIFSPFVDEPYFKIRCDEKHIRTEYKSYQQFDPPKQKQFDYYAVWAWKIVDKNNFVDMSCVSSSHCQNVLAITTEISINDKDEVINSYSSFYVFKDENFKNDRIDYVSNHYYKLTPFVFAKAVVRIDECIDMVLLTEAAKQFCHD